MTSKKSLLITGSIIIVISVFSFVYILNKQEHRGNNNAMTGMKIGISIYDQYDTYVSSLVDYIKDRAKSLEQEKDITITLTIVNSGGNQMTQNYQVEDFIEQQYDLLCVNLADRTDASTAIDMGMNADIPIIFFNRELVEKDLERWDKLFYVGAVALESGIMQGDIVVNAWKKDKNLLDKNEDGILQYVILEGEPGHQDASIRTEYVIKTITEAGINVEKLGDEIANWKRAQAETSMSQWLKTYDDEIEIVIANNDDMALGAIDAIKKANVADPPAVVGIDGTMAGLEAVKNGDMIGTVLNDAKGQAVGVIELAYSIVFNTELPDNIELMEGKYIRKPHLMITKENVDYYISD
jgi:methyl-galactoside transport system substrate-binding protein